MEVEICDFGISRKMFAWKNSEISTFHLMSGTIAILNSLHNSLSKGDQNIYRVFNLQKGMTFYYAAGGEDVSRYMAAQLAQGSGLASNEAVPPYTNMVNAYGVFSSRHFQQIDSVLLNADGLDSLACSPLAAGLRFKGSFGQICN